LAPKNEEDEEKEKKRRRRDLKKDVEVLTVKVGFPS
jgi:hypothetical protein